MVIALRHDDVIGFVAAAGDTLDALFVVPSDAGAGLGTALLDAIGPVARLWVLAENPSRSRVLRTPRLAVIRCC